MQDPPTDKMKDNGLLNANLKYYYYFFNVVQKCTHGFSGLESAIFYLTTR